MNLRSENPMRLVSAVYRKVNETDEVRFLFYYQKNGEQIGAMLILANPTIRVPGDQDSEEYDLALEDIEKYTEALCNPTCGIPVGIGFHKTEAQIVDYDGPNWLFHIVASSFAYSGNVILDIKEEG